MEVVGRPYNVYNPKQARLDLDSMILDILLRYLVVFDDSNELQGYQQPTMLSYPGSFEWEIKLVDHALQPLFWADAPFCERPLLSCV